MSRNLCSTSCERCHAEPTLDERPRRITRADAGRYFDEYEGMLVASATCHQCGALYLAWCDERARRRYPSDRGCGHPFHDLSYRSSFNDEPGPDDMPPWAPPPTAMERLTAERDAWMALAVARSAYHDPNDIAVRQAAWPRLLSAAQDVRALGFNSDTGERLEASR